MRSSALVHEPVCGWSVDGITVFHRYCNDFGTLISCSVGSENYGGSRLIAPVSLLVSLSQRKHSLCLNYSPRREENRPHLSRKWSVTRRLFRRFPWGWSAGKVWWDRRQVTEMFFWEPFSFQYHKSCNPVCQRSGVCSRWRGRSIYRNCRRYFSRTAFCVTQLRNQYTKPFNEISGVVTELQKCAE